ncbi:MAG: PLDc N-terminal domain-containing protein [Lachnospiraceae bacterium]|nr:PLDc N-terminal domain-containing protein [Lachnospiraceae bacterium]
MTVLAGSMVASIFVGVLIPIAAIAMTILLAVWIYRDATNKGMNGILWTLVVILVPSFIGLIVYLCVRYDAKKVTCSKCLKQVNGSSKFCSNCGQELVPVVEVSDQDANFKKSQRNILIGFFVSLGVMIVSTMLMVAFVLTGLVGIVDTAVSTVNEISEVVSDDTLDALTNLDALLGEEGIRIRVNGDKVYIRDEEGNDLIYVDGDKEIVDVDLVSIKELMDKYEIDYDDSITDEDVQEAIENILTDKEAQESLGQILEDLEDTEDIDNLEDLQNAIDKLKKDYSKYKSSQE